MQTTQKHCPNCGPVLAQKESANHILHLLLTIVTGGLWIVIWILVTFGTTFAQWKCNKCGQNLGVM